MTEQDWVLDSPQSAPKVPKEPTDWVLDSAPKSAPTDWVLDSPFAGAKASGKAVVGPLGGSVVGDTLKDTAKPIVEEGEGWASGYASRAATALDNVDFLADKVGLKIFKGGSQWWADAAKKMGRQAIEPRQWEYKSLPPREYNPNAPGPIEAIAQLAQENQQQALDPTEKSSFAPTPLAPRQVLVAGKPTKSIGQTVTDIAHSVRDAITGLAVDLPVMALPGGLPIWGATMGAAEAGKTGQNELVGAATGAVQNELFAKIIQFGSGLPMAGRIPALGVAGAAITPGGLKEKTEGALTAVALGLNVGNKISFDEFKSRYKGYFNEYSKVIDQNRMREIFDKAEPGAMKLGYYPENAAPETGKAPEVAPQTVPTVPSVPVKGGTISPGAGDLTPPPTTLAAPPETARKWGVNSKLDEKLGELTDQAGPPPIAPTETIPESAQTVRDLSRKIVAPETPAPPLPGAGGTTLEMNIIPGAKEFIQQDVVPAAKNTYETIRNTAKSIKDFINPAGASLEAARTGDIIRKNSATAALDFLRTTTDLRDARAAASKLPKEANYEVMSAMSTGRPIADPYLSGVAAQMSDVFAAKAKEVQDLAPGELDTLRKHYFPGIWKDVSKARELAKEQMAGQKAMGGSRAFMKPKLFDDWADGIKAGLEPVSDNFVDMGLLKVQEVNKFLAAERSIKQTYQEGLVKKADEPHPSNWVALDSRITAGLKVEKPLGTGEFLPFDTPEATKDIPKLEGGTYYAPAEVARLINQYLSPGLRGKPVYDAYQKWANVLNQAQLGLSAFHVGAVAINAMVSKLGLGLYQIGHPGTKNLAGIARNTMGGLVNGIGGMFIAPVEYFKRGGQFTKELMAPGSTTQDLADMVSHWASGGGRARMDPIYATRVAEKAAEMFKNGNFWGGAMRLPFGAMEKFSRPIFEELVPRLKLGTFLDMAKFDVKRLTEKGASDAEIQHQMGKVWDSIDNRYGQLTYDNLFWNKAFKDLSLASVRSVGWNFGTWREIGGAVTDLAKGAATGKLEMTHRMSYTAALPIVVGIMGGFITKLSTGENPKDLKDYFYPRTGRLDKYGKPERVSLPSYMKDIYHMTMDPLGTVGAKIHPGLNSIIEMIQNKDFYNVKIFEKSDDPNIIPRLGKFLGDFAEFQGKQLIPFSLRNMLQERSVGAGVAGQVAPWFGVVPAPAIIQKTAAEKMMTSFIKEKVGNAPMTKDEAALKDVRAKSTNLLRQGKAVPQDLLDKMRGLSDRQIKNIAKNASAPSFESAYGKLSLSQAVDVYNAANLEEKGMSLEILSKKIESAAKDNPAEVIKNLAALQSIISDQDTIRKATGAVLNKYQKKQ